MGGSRPKNHGHPGPASDELGGAWLLCRLILFAFPVVVLVLGSTLCFLPAALVLGHVVWSRPSRTPSLCSVYLPNFVYDLGAWWFWPLNLLISFVASFGQRADAIPVKSEAASGLSLERTRAAVMANSRRMVSESELLELFDTLAPATTRHMLRNWHGRVVYTGSMLDYADKLVAWPLEKLGVRWGKRYRNTFHGDPLLINLFGWLYLPAIVWGNVGVPTVGFRGKENAAMVYDHQPWQDHFRILRDGKDNSPMIILGVWCSRGRFGGWFTLEENLSLDAATSHVHQLEQ